MKQINSLSELQKIELEILDYVVELCQQNNLRYFLAGGTLLGAIRHKGFIPWDNDIDIAMPRPDYDQFICIIEKQNDSRYQLMRMKNNNEYYYSFSKVVDTKTMIREIYRKIQIPGLGVYIDIFPLDGFGNDFNYALKSIKNVRYLSAKVSGGRLNLDGFKGIGLVKQLVKRVLFRLLNREKLINRIENKLRKHGFDESEYVGSTYGLRSEKEVMKQKYYSDYIMVDFNGKQYRAPCGYDYYLKRMYGDYMKLPPVDKRIEPHDIEVFWK